MMFRGKSLRWRLFSIVGLTFANLVAMIVVDNVTSVRLDRDLDAVEQKYVPLLRYGPEMEAEFDDLRRAMQDAVSAQDSDALDEAAVLRQETRALLRNAPAAIDHADLTRLEQDFDSWAGLAFDLSRRMLEEETGQAVIEDIETMQRAQRRTWGTLERTVFFDETALSHAFGNARNAHHAAARTRRVFHVGLFVAVGVVILVIARRTLSAFAKLREGFGRFGRGDFTTAVDIPGDDELASLGTSANRMARHIGELQGGLQAKQAALEQANRELESFSYSVSHDLRAPLRGIDGFSQALLEDYGEELDDTARDYLRRVREGAQRMGHLIDDMLSLSRIGRTEVSRAAVNATALATRVAGRLEDSDPSREVEWVIEEAMFAQADERLFAILLENLLGNAWKFSSRRQDARIEFGKRPEDGSEVFFVRDNGAGFDMAYADKLFGAFQRLHCASEFEGTGIGLATVNRIVRKHGGKIWAEGQVGKGATFYFTLTGEKGT